MYPLANTATNNAIPYNLDMAGTVWKRVLEAHEDAGLPRTQTAVAKTCGITQPAVQRWSVGTNVPTLKQAIIFGQKMGVCVEWIYTGRGPKHPTAKPGSATDTVLKLFHALDTASKNEVLRFVEFHVSRNADKPDPECKTSTKQPLTGRY